MLLQFSRVAQLTFVLLFVSQGNKGGVSVHLSFYGHLLCFLNCHLAAHMNFASERVDEFEYIIDTQTFECKKAPRIVDHRWCSNSNVEIWIWHTFTVNCLCTIPRLVFWFGDLNFRIQDHGMHFVRSCINRQTYNLLWSKDQVGKQSPRHLGCVISPVYFGSSPTSWSVCCHLQLMMMKQKEQLLQEFDEGPLDFQPTYKFDLNSDEYDSR